MYLGSSEKIKEKIREYNQHSDGFIFNLRDLEMDLERVDEGWYNITSLELRNSLREIVARKVGNRDNISVPTAIKLNFASFLSPFNRYFYTHWVRIEKEKLCEVAQNSIVGRRSNRLFYGSEKGGIIYLDSFFPRLDKASIEKEKEESKKYCEKLYEEIRNVNREIVEEIEKAKIDNNELEGIQFILPTYCRCEFATSDYLNHMLECLAKGEQIDAFKNEILELIQTNKARIDRIKQEVITKIENLMKEKGLSEERFIFLSCRSKFWREEIKNTCNRKEIEREEKFFLRTVETLSESEKEWEKKKKEWEEEINKSEERSKEIEEEIREFERKVKEREQERNKERKKREEDRGKEEESRKKEQEQKRQNREEENKKEQEEIDLKAEKLRKKIKEDLKNLPENFPSKNDDHQPEPVYLSSLTDETESHPIRKENKNNPEKNPSLIADKRKEELSSMIGQLKKEIKELKNNMNPTNSEQKLLLSQKEEELRKLEVQFNKINASKNSIFGNKSSAKLFISGGIIVTIFCFLALLIRKRKRLKKR